MKMASCQKRTYKESTILDIIELSFNYFFYINRNALQLQQNDYFREYQKIIG